MFSSDSDQGQVKYSPLYGQGSKLTIFVAGYFQSGMLENERASKKNGSWETFFLKIGDLTKSVLFWRAYPTPLRAKGRFW